MGVSAIIPIHNEASVLERVLATIDDQTQKPDELILVLDACTDRSEAIARMHTAKIVPVKLYNMSAAVLAGIHEATHEILVLFDGNTLVPRDYIAKLREVQERTKADLVEWHGGMMLFPRTTLGRYGTPSLMHLWTLEYFLRIESQGGQVVHLDGPYERLKRSPLKRNIRYGLDYAELSGRYNLAPLFRIGTKSGFAPDLFATCGVVIGHIRLHRFRRAFWDLFHSSRER